MKNARGILAHSGAHRRIDRAVVKMQRGLFLDGDCMAFGIGSGPCRLCRSCSSDEGSTKPCLARPATEAHGLERGIALQWG